MRSHRVAILVAALGLLLLLLAGPGVRLGVWSLHTGFSLLRWAAYLGLAGAAAGLLLLVLPRSRRAGGSALMAAVVVGLIAAGVPWFWRHRAEAVPPIHDITTDTDHPPEFVAVLPLRADAPNPATYGGPDVAKAQRAAYPELRPLVLASTPPGSAFAAALAQARRAGWALVAADSGDGRIEGTATTGWFGFKDDVVIRIRPNGAGSRVDVRSVSRLGESDVGTNAHRIRDFLHGLEHRVR